MQLFTIICICNYSKWWLERDIYSICRRSWKIATCVTCESFKHLVSNCVSLLGNNVGEITNGNSCPNLSFFLLFFCWGLVIRTVSKNSINSNRSRMDTFGSELELLSSLLTLVCADILDYINNNITDFMKYSIELYGEYQCGVSVNLSGTFFSVFN